MLSTETQWEAISASQNVRQSSIQTKEQTGKDMSDKMAMLNKIDQQLACL